MKQSKISVRQLVEFILKKGSIDSSQNNSTHTALEGARIHRKLQKEAGDSYQKEVFLKTEVVFEELTLNIEGRADGVFEKEGQWIIDEIKTSEPRFEELEPYQIDLFFYQAMVYGYIYLSQNELEEITIQLTYFQTIEEIITRTTRHFSAHELEEFFNQLVADYKEWVIFKENWRILRNTSLKALKFPYGDYRTGQRELAVAAYKTIRTKQKLFVEAPTGTGKTISTLFPTLKAIGEEEGERVFYLTAKTITRQVAEDALVALSEAGAKTKSVTLTAKDKICFLTERNCTPEHCIYANGYYDRLNEGLWDLLNHENQMNREVIERYAKKHTLCPFELSLDVSLWCDIIIGDYNYLFDPTVYLRRFFEQEENEENIFLIDEAHNLVNRSREMYSATIEKNRCSEVIFELGSEHKKLQRVLKKVSKEFLSIEKIAEEDGWSYHHQKQPAESLINQLYKLSEKMQEWLAEFPEDPAQPKVLSYYFDVLRFLKMSEFYDDHYETTIERKLGDLIVRQFCIDPSDFLESSLSKGVASLLFSASFSPLSYYQTVLGGKESLAYRLPSPFPMNNQRIIVANYIETTYQKRQASEPDVVQAIGDLVQAKTGNYLVFFPSYHYLDNVAEGFKQEYPGIQTLIQDTHMNEEEREAFLEKFEKDPKKTLVGFCVLGGIFSEGIDLKGSRLIGTAIVGVGLPQMNHEQELIKEYYDEEEKNGFSFAYQLPGMNKVLQAAGRVIRDVSDVGVVLLLDRRFKTPRYQELFPPHWQHYKTAFNSLQLKEEIKNFWQTTDKKNGLTN
ncbi:hypothetical protein IGI37_001704 [Enterococcus sp. AZ194]|uniref:helicase C-terminal domain-containing protein n=1 Tax=Enterococcus sp. AZ194 TaxID=2774629 RepID=UPI003F270061